MNTPAPDSFYNVRGTMPSTSPSYVKRKADDQIYDALSRGEYCFVLTSRQVGKSSLMARAAVTMRANKNGAAVVVLDITSQGENITPQQWYGGLLDQIGEQLHIEDELEADRRAHADVGVLPRWIGAIVRVALAALGKRPLVIFIDEVDFTRTLPFKTDEFFAGIRECYNRRTVEPEMSRLTFCLIGSARPVDLIRDIRTTPFNVGQRIDLTDFTLEEALPLASGLHADAAQGRALLERVLYWTGGHPYLTQKLCREVASDTAGAGLSAKRRVDAICYRLFLSPRGRDNDDNLVFVRDRILRTEEDLARVMDFYRNVLDGKRVKSEDNNPVIGVVRLAGIVRLVDLHLVIRNRIYRRVFDRKWVEANMPDQEKRRQRAAFRRGLVRLGVPAAVIVAMVSALAVYALIEREVAKHHLTEATAAKYAAQRSARDAKAANERVLKVLSTAFKSNGAFLRATEFTGMSGATRDLVVRTALGQLKTLPLDSSVRNEADISIQSSVANAYDAIGRVQHKMLELEIGDPAEARSSFQAALDIRQKLVGTGQLTDAALVDLRWRSANDMQNLGNVLSWPGPADETPKARDERLGLAVQEFRDALDIRKDQLSRHTGDSKFAVALARTLTALGDFLRKEPQETPRGGFKPPAECYQQAAMTLEGLHSPPLQAPDAENNGDNLNSPMVETVRANAFEQLGTLLEEDPGTFQSAEASLKKAADESAARADVYINDPAWGRSRDCVNMSLDAARKKLELAKYEDKAGNRSQARSDLEKSADYLGVKLAAPAVADVHGLLLEELVPVNIDVRACLAEVYALAAALDAGEGGANRNCATALEMRRRATQERLVIHELNPESRNAVNALARAQLQEGYAVRRAIGAREARIVFKRAYDVYQANAGRAAPGTRDRLTADVQVIESLEETGIATHEMGNFTEAGENLREALKRLADLGLSNPPAVVQWRRARALSALGDNWAAQKEYTKAIKFYDDAIKIETDLHEDSAKPGGPIPEAAERRLERAHSVAGRAAALGALGRKDDTRAGLDSLAGDLGTLKVIEDLTSRFNDARLLELLIDAQLDVARAWKSIGDWEQAAAALKAVSLAQNSNMRDHKSVVAGISDTELMVLRAEINYNLWVAAMKMGQSDVARGWQQFVDQQQNYLDFYASRRSKDPDSYRGLAQFTTILRFAGLINSATQPAAGDPNRSRDTADHLLRDALKFRESGAVRYPIDVDVADTILESFKDLKGLLATREKTADEIERLRIEAVEAIKRLEAGYTKESSPKLSALTALVKLYQQCPTSNAELAAESQRSAEESIRAADQCAAKIKTDYPDAFQRWQDIRGSFGRVN